MPKAGTPQTKQGYANSANGFRHAGRGLTQRRIQITKNNGGSKVRKRWSGSGTATVTAKGTNGQPSPSMRGDQDSDRQEARTVADRSSQPQTSAGGHDGARPLHAGGGNFDINANESGDAGAPPDVSAELRSEIGALLAYYAARIAAAQRSLPAGEVAAAVKALVNEQTVAMRTLTERWSAATQKQRAEKPQRPTGNAQRRGDEAKPS